MYVCPGNMRVYTCVRARARARAAQGFMFKTHPWLVFLPPRVLASPCLLFPALFFLFRQDYQGLMRDWEDDIKEEKRSDRRRWRASKTNVSIRIKIAVTSVTLCLFYRFKKKTHPHSVYFTGLYILMLHKLILHLANTRWGEHAHWHASCLYSKVSSVFTGDSFQANSEKLAAAAI